MADVNWMVATTLHFIRHGESVGQVHGPVERRVRGMRGDGGLSPRGVWQMERLRDRLARTGEIAADVVLASTLPRTMQSAEILAPVWGLPLVREDDLHELRPGIADGMRYDEAKARYPRADFTREPLQPAWPGGESWGMFTLRVGALLDHVTREYAGKTVVLVTSGGVIHATFVAFCALPTLRLPAAWFATRNASITSWQVRPPDAVWPRTRLLRYNDDAHPRDERHDVKEEPAR